MFSLFAVVSSRTFGLSTLFLLMPSTQLAWSACHTAPRYEIAGGPAPVVVGMKPLVCPYWLALIGSPSLACLHWLGLMSLLCSSCPVKTQGFPCQTEPSPEARRIPTNPA